MMKILTRLMSLFAVAALTVTFMNCGGGGGETPAEQVQLGKLSKTWSIVSVKLGTEDKISLFSGFKLTITGTFNNSNPEGPYDFSVSGNRQDPSPWPVSGKWEFNSIGSGDSGTITRSDDVPMEYSINSSGQLTIKFTCPEGVCTYPNARAGSVVGNWEFVFN